MGACDFIDTGSGSTCAAAFENAVAQARYNYGHAGYTGTIAEKDSWVIIESTPMEQTQAVDLAQKLINDGDPRIDDKWGPAGAIAMKDGKWLFFGWASL